MAADGGVGRGSRFSSHILEEAREFERRLRDPVVAMLHPGAVDVTEEEAYWRAVLGALFHLLLPGVRGEVMGVGVRLRGGRGVWGEVAKGKAGMYLDAMRCGVIAILREILAVRVMGMCFANLSDRLNQFVVNNLAAAAPGGAAEAAAGSAVVGDAGTGTGDNQTAAAAEHSEPTEPAPKKKLRHRGEGGAGGGGGTSGHRRVQSDGGMSAMSVAVFESEAAEPHEQARPRSYPAVASSASVPGIDGDAGAGGTVGVHGKLAAVTSSTTAEKRKLSPFRKDGRVGSWFRARNRWRSFSADPGQRDGVGGGGGEGGDSDLDDKAEELIGRRWAEDFDLEVELQRNESYLGSSGERERERERAREREGEKDEDSLPQNGTAATQGRNGATGSSEGSGEGAGGLGGEEGVWGAGESNLETDLQDVGSRWGLDPEVKGGWEEEGRGKNGGRLQREVYGSPDMSRDLSRSHGVYEGAWEGEVSLAYIYVRPPGSALKDDDSCPSVSSSSRPRGLGSGGECSTPAQGGGRGGGEGGTRVKIERNACDCEAVKGSRGVVGGGRGVGTKGDLVVHVGIISARVVTVSDVDAGGAGRGGGKARVVGAAGDGGEETDMLYILWRC